MKFLFDIIHEQNESLKMAAATIDSLTKERRRLLKLNLKQAIRNMEEVLKEIAEECWIKPPVPMTDKEIDEIIESKINTRRKAA